MHYPPLPRRRRGPPRVLTEKTDLIELTLVAAMRVATIDALLGRTFEPRRRTRTSYKVRSDAAVVSALSFAAIDGGELVGTVQCWPVCYVLDACAPVPLMMVGSIARSRPTASATVLTAC